VSEMNIHFKNLDAAPLDDEIMLQNLASTINLNTQSGKERIRYEDDIYNLNVGLSCPWFTHYRDLYLHYAKLRLKIL
jgi:hypothetical protein